MLTYRLRLLSMGSRFRGNDGPGLRATALFANSTKPTYTPAVASPEADKTLGVLRR
jgi:hypothetical protein